MIGSVTEAELATLWIGADGKKMGLCC
jgi:hypothetical protein